MNIEKIEDKIDKTVAGATEIEMSLGGVKFQTMMELMEFAKLMAIADVAIPAHLRGKPGACLGVCTRALRFGFDPFVLAEHSMVMKKSNKRPDGQWEDVETLAFDSFVIRAIVEAHAPIDGRLKYSYEGDGDARVCIVTGTPKGQTEPLTFKSKPLGERKKDIGRNNEGKLKGSPLWDTKPDVQMAYDAGRDFCRINFPATLLGWYDKEELAEHGFVGPEHAKDVTPKPAIADRLKGSKGRGFNKEHVEKEIDNSAARNPADGKAGEPTAEKSVSPADPLEELLDTKAEPEPDPRAEAFNAGEAARDAGKPLLSVPEQFKKNMALSDAYQDGWRDRDKQILAEKAA